MLDINSGLSNRTFDTIEDAITDIKKGLKENTLVATIKSHTHNVPTLIIEHT